MIQSVEILQVYYFLWSSLSYQLLIEIQDQVLDDDLAWNDKLLLVPVVPACTDMKYN
jgi:hypothetical protein